MITGRFSLLPSPEERTVTAPTFEKGTPAVRERLRSIDILRGLAMVLMALDHTRDFFHSETFLYSPTDLSLASAGLFLTRWITHFCAPAFFLLAGSGAYLRRSRGKNAQELSGFLFTRGMFLILLELTVIRFAWDFDLNFRHGMTGGVIWALGWSMTALALLSFFPWWFNATLGAILIGTHNLADAWSPGRFGELSWVWRILHVHGPMELAPGFFFSVAYPLIPWVGVMFLGYGFGRILTLSQKSRRTILMTAGIAITGMFVVVRMQNGFGQATPWTEQGNSLRTAFSFVNCHKYPPSLAFLLMTLGPSVFLLGLLDITAPAVLNPFKTFGRAPFLFYVLHLFLIHGLAVILAIQKYGSAPWLLQTPPVGVFPFPAPEGYGYGLITVYVFWILIVAVLYLPCHWFANLRARRLWTWMAYL